MLDICFMEKNMAKKETQKDNLTQELIKSADIDYVNKMLENSEDLKEFKISKSTLSNIASWALNGESDKDIREHLDLNKHQFAILCTVCPTLIVIMDRSRAMADLIVAGSLFQTAVGGKHVRKQQLIKVGIYDGGIKIGEKVEKQWVEEELPPNPMLLKFLAENKLSEQFGEHKGVDEEKMKKLADSFSDRDRALIEQASKKFKEELDGKN